MSEQMWISTSLNNLTSDRKYMSNSHRKTKIIATLGPASRSKERIMQLISAGANVFRLNFSHGSHEEHLQTLNAIRAAAKELNAVVAVLQDLSGPKIRISMVQDDYVNIPDGSEVILEKSHQSISTASHIFVEGLDPAEVASAGEIALLADGIITLRVRSVHGSKVHCTAEKGGRLRSRVGIAFPDSAINLPATTEKDFIDLEWGIEHRIDYVAISFVKNAADIEGIRARINEAGAGLNIIAKIERKQALEFIDEIVEAADGLMVARGDLGLELPLERLPLIQKDLIARGNHRGIPVIVATQMLHSMITSVRPTRAEVSDIATAVMSGADAVMLSEETAIGENPIESVKYLSLIAREAEKSFEFEEYRLRLRDADRQSMPDAVSYAACAAAVKLGALAIIACSRTGTSARLLAKYRPQQALYGVSTSEEALRRMALYWGVQPLLIGEVTNREGEVNRAIEAIGSQLQLSPGSRVVITGGSFVNTPGSTNMMEVREISR